MSQSTRTCLRHQLGYQLLGLSIAMLAVCLATLGGARSTISDFKLAIGQKIGAELETVKNALNAYMDANADALKEGSPIAGVASPNAPTVAELRALQFLKEGIPDTPTSGGAYRTSIWLVPKGTDGTQQLKGMVLLREPIYSPDSKTTDIQLLSAATEASPTRDIGFSKIDAVAPRRALQIYLPTGVIAPNPDPLKRAGILYATAEQKPSLIPFWQAPVNTTDALPALGNLYDGRLVQANNRPYLYDGMNPSLNLGWKELFSSGVQSTNVAMGQGSAVQTPSASQTMLNNVYAGASAGAAAGQVMSRGTNIGKSSDSVLVGFEAGKSTTGRSQVFVGSQSGTVDFSGWSNVFLGTQTGGADRYSDESTIAGFQAGKQASHVERLTALGANAGASSTYGRDLVLVGPGAGKALTTGSFNVFQGTNAGMSTLSSSYSVFIGHQSGALGRYFDRNVYVGYNTGASTSATAYSQSTSVLLGSTAGMSLEDNRNNVYAGFGACARLSTPSADSICIGSKAGANQSAASNNILLGVEAGLNLSGGSSMFIGHQAGKSHTSGNNNTFVGTRTGALNQTATNSVAIGMDAQIGENLTEAVAIGYGAVANSSYSVQFGNQLVTRIGGQVPWSIDSDRRLKTNIQNTSRGLDFVRQLRPVDYTLLANQRKETGFIAQEVEAIDPSFPGVHKPQNAQDYYSVAYTDFIPAIVKALQTLDTKAPAVIAPHPYRHVVKWGLCALFFALLGGVMRLFQLNHHLFKELKVLKLALHHRSLTPAHA
jgi:hypothetical protein